MYSYIHESPNMQHPLIPSHACLPRYGAYGSRALLPKFNRMDLALLDRGVVLAAAHVSLTA